MEDIQRKVEILNLISDHPSIAELLDSYEDSLHVYLVSLRAHTVTANPIAVLMAVHIVGTCKCARRVVSKKDSWLCQSFGCSSAELHISGLLSCCVRYVDSAAL